MAAMTSPADTIRVVVAAPHRPAEVREIANTLEAMQAIVGGYIEELPRWGDIAGCVVVVNEEGRPDGLQPNREWPAGSELLGTFLVTKHGTNADYVSLTEVEAAEIVRLLESRKTGN
jgi:hypothetical protein